MKNYKMQQRCQQRKRVQWKSHWKVRHIINCFNERHKQKLKGGQQQRGYSQCSSKSCKKEETPSTFVRAQMNDNNLSFYIVEQMLPPYLYSAPRYSAILLMLVAYLSACVQSDFSNIWPDSLAQLLPCGKDRWNCRAKHIAERQQRASNGLFDTSGPARQASSLVYLLSAENASMQTPCPNKTLSDTSAHFMHNDESGRSVSNLILLMKVQFFYLPVIHPRTNSLCSLQSPFVSCKCGRCYQHR